VEFQETFVTRMRDFAHLRPTINATDDDGRLATTTLTTTTTGAALVPCARGLQTLRMRFGPCERAAYDIKTEE
jgi:hypothetical protein